MSMAILLLKKKRKKKKNINELSVLSWFIGMAAYAMVRYYCEIHNDIYLGPI